MQRSSSDAATDVSFSPNEYTYQLMRSRPPASWPFACWGLDMISPFKPAPGNFRCVFVLIDKFSKWIKYMLLIKASSENVVEFLNQIIHRFGLPNNIITDLGTQFTGSAF
jgi:hypothetical protein